MATIAEALTQAIQLHQAGQLPRAEQLYRQILDVDPTHASALHLLGIVAHQRGQPQQALAYLRQAAGYAPQDASVHSDLGLVYQSVGQPDEAVASYRQALQLRPDNPDAHFKLGTALADREELDDAIGCYRQALRLRPDHPEAHLSLGAALADQGLGDEAIASFHRAMELRSDFPEVHYNLAATLFDLGRLEEAAASYRQALLLRPDFREALNNLVVVLLNQGLVADAHAWCREAVVRWPDDSLAHLNLGQMWLLQGDYETGWAEFTLGLHQPEILARGFPQPVWDGSVLDGRRILLFTEQGLGDTLQFVRYAPLVQARGGSVLVECQPALLPLLAGCPGIDGLAARRDALPPFDVQASLLSLPCLLGTRLDTIPAAVPYLNAAPEGVQRWRPEMMEGRVKVGIAWQGNLQHKRHRQRSAALAQLAPLANVAGVRLYSLQKGAGTEQLGEAGLSVTDLGSRFENFADMAAVMKGLDLVVTVDTAVAHCAGALGVPVWVALRFAADWRWLLDREDSPWYPTMRFFRQKQPGQWPEVFERIAWELATLVE